MSKQRQVDCPDCQGEGGWDADDQRYGWVPCSNCGGMGTILAIDPSDDDEEYEGQLILNFSV